VIVTTKSGDESQRRGDETEYGTAAKRIGGESINHDDDDYGGTCTSKTVGETVLDKRRKLKKAGGNGGLESDNSNNSFVQTSQLSPGGKYQARPSGMASGLSYGSKMTPATGGMSSGFAGNID